MLQWKERGALVNGHRSSYDSEAFKGVIWFNIETEPGSDKFKISIHGATSVNFRNRFVAVEEAKAACEKWYIMQLKKELDKFTNAVTPETKTN